ncbi:MAG: hypothetical protein PHO31_01120 [Candidatus Pacebacteria bacterium]|nr:hypothetical protein [Candidatus Paceibacterota bacterium]
MAELNEIKQYLSFIKAIGVRKKNRYFALQLFFCFLDTLANIYYPKERNSASRYEKLLNKIDVLDGISIVSNWDLDYEMPLPRFLWKIRCAFVHFLPSDFEKSIIVEYSESNYPYAFMKGYYLYINLKSLITLLESIIDISIKDKYFKKNFYKLYKKEFIELRKIIEGDFKPSKKSKNYLKKVN